MRIVYVLHAVTHSWTRWASHSFSSAYASTKTDRYFLSMRKCVPVLIYPLQWSDVSVYLSLFLSLICLVLFFLVEIFVAVEPVLPPFLLTQKIPLLVGASNALVAVCNLSVTYFFPVWFQTVMLSSASTAGMTRFYVMVMSMERLFVRLQDCIFYRIVSVSPRVRYLRGEHQS